MYFTAYYEGYSMYIVDWVLKMKYVIAAVNVAHSCHCNIIIFLQ